ncbi:MAG: hypothetical protein J2P54_23290, partial [Bradyrhizobiaceae bacterium]|nr:hypothetical protein [Bradyrhizobiaceae bacterium]
MVGWSKKLEDFNIRAAIQLRREQFSRRILDARRAAGPQIHAAGAAMAARLRAAGAGVSGGAREGLGVASFGAQRLAAAGAVVRQKVGTAFAPAW